MKSVASIVCALTLASGVSLAQDAPADPQPLACVPPARARELLFDRKLVAPVRAMRQAGATVQAEAIDIQLCWFRTTLVYDVTLLSRDGRVIHRLIQAVSGDVLGGPEK